MDPNATLALVLDGEKEARNDLNDWLNRGGFGPRVMAHVATDAWMSGDRYGTVTKIGTRYVHVLMDTSGRTRRFAFDNVVPLY